VLLVAMVAAVALTLRKRKGIKYMHPSDQVAVKREGRVELVKIAGRERRLNPHANKETHR